MCGKSFVRLIEAFNLILLFGIKLWHHLAIALVSLLEFIFEIFDVSRSNGMNENQISSTRVLVVVSATVAIITQRMTNECAKNYPDIYTKGKARDIYNRRDCVVIELSVPYLPLSN